MSFESESLSGIYFITVQPVRILCKVKMLENYQHTRITKAASGKVHLYSLIEHFK